MRSVGGRRLGAAGSADLIAIVVITPRRRISSAMIFLALRVGVAWMERKTALSFRIRFALLPFISAAAVAAQFSAAQHGGDLKAISRPVQSPAERTEEGCDRQKPKSIILSSEMQKRRL